MAVDVDDQEDRVLTDRGGIAVPAGVGLHGTTVLLALLLAVAVAGLWFTLPPDQRWRAIVVLLVTAAVALGIVGLIG